MMNWKIYTQCKKAVVAYLNYYSVIFMERLRNTTESLIQESRHGLRFEFGAS
jgi:hypothetical protein